jgi:hypothetical protein
LNPVDDTKTANTAGYEIMDGTDVTGIALLYAGGSCPKGGEYKMNVTI